MKLARELLDFGETELALERLKMLFEVIDAKDEWRLHELFGRAFHDLGVAEGAVKAYFAAAQTDTILRKQREHWSNYIFALHYLPEVKASKLRDAARVYNSLYRDLEPLKLLPQKSGKIHVAYISPSFIDSSAARFYEALLTDYDREKFFVTAWDLSELKDNFTQKIIRHVDKYFDISATSYEEAAIQIRDTGADILFDLGGHSAGGVTLQVAAYKPARVQISGIGYFDSTGLDAIDYFLTDNFLIRGTRTLNEDVLRIKNAFAFKPNEQMIRAKNNFRRAEKNFAYGCLNNFMKITDEYLENLRKILEENPGARIFFRDTVPLASRQKYLLQRIYSAGIDLARVQVNYAEKNFLDDYAALDKILDTYPYNGGFMTALALYMGVEVLTRAGKYHHSRIGADIFRIFEAGELFDTENFVAEVYGKFSKLVDKTA